MLLGSSFINFRLFRRRSLAISLGLLPLCLAANQVNANAATTLSKVHVGPSDSGYAMFVLTADSGKENKIRIKKYVPALAGPSVFNIVDEADHFKLDPNTDIADFCAPVTANEVKCDTSTENEYLNKVAIATGDQNDSVSVERGKDLLFESLGDYSGCRKVTGIDIVPVIPAAFPIRLDVNGGSGNDYISGGCGADYLFGDEGNDILIGTRDRDLNGNDVKDTLDCGNGDSDSYLKDSKDTIANCEKLFQLNF